MWTPRQTPPLSRRAGGMVSRLAPGHPGSSSPPVGSWPMSSWDRDVYRQKQAQVPAPKPAERSAQRTLELSKVREATLKLPDGVSLFYRAWLPQTKPTKAVFLLHRGHEHSGRMSGVAKALLGPDTAIFAWDARGHGRSPGRPGYTPSFTQWVRDLDAFVRQITKSHGIALEDTAVVGQSAGAVTAAAWVHDFAPPIRSLVLVTPALRLKLYIPFAMTGLRIWNRLRGGDPTFIKSYSKARFLTHDKEQQRRYKEDPLITHETSISALLGLYDAGTRLLQDAAAIRVPTLVLAGESDHVVRLDAQRNFFDKLGCASKKLRIFPGAHHDLLHEENRQEVLSTLGDFVRQSFLHREPKRTLLRADRAGHTRQEVEELLRPLPLGSFKGLSTSITRIALRTLGRLSQGIRLGLTTGFDSGESLDYVYQNRARGCSFLGRAIDRWYLDSMSWQGIRQRKIQIEKTLRYTIGCWHEAGQAVHVMDIAAGTGRYVLNVLGSLPTEGSSATLRDYSPRNVEVGRALAERRGLSKVTFDVADAFDRESLAAVRPRPNIAIVSGLYELYPTNCRVQTSLQGIADALGDGGYLIYTNQPWHPQLETIARTLENRDGAPWVMRRRTQEEMDDLVRAAGFEKISMEIDDQGFFTVSLARIGQVP